MTFPKLALCALLSTGLVAPLASVAHAQDAMMKHDGMKKKHTMKKKDGMMKGDAMQKDQTAQ